MSPLIRPLIVFSIARGDNYPDIGGYEVSDGLVHKWKKELKERGADVFNSTSKQAKDNSQELEIGKLYQRIGQLSTENEFLKKVVGD